MQTYRVTILRGAIVGAGVESIHMDDNTYENAKKFDGFRFSKVLERDGETP